MSDACNCGHGIKQEGIVLLATLLIISLLSLLVLSQLQGVFLYHKAANRFIARQQIFHQLEAEANRLVLNKACIVKRNDPNEIFRLLKNKQGCSFIKDKQHFFYQIEELGLFPCLQILNNERLKSTRHWRISLLTVNEKPMMLQLRIAEEAPLIACEKQKPVHIHQGIISWRYLQGN